VRPALPRASASKVCSPRGRGPGEHASKRRAASGPHAAPRCQPTLPALASASLATLFRRWKLPLGRAAAAAAAGTPAAPRVLPARLLPSAAPPPAPSPPVAPPASQAPAPSTPACQVAFRAPHPRSRKHRPPRGRGPRPRESLRYSPRPPSLYRPPPPLVYPPLQKRRPPNSVRAQGRLKETAAAELPWSAPQRPTTPVIHRGRFRPLSERRTSPRRYLSTALSPERRLHPLPSRALPRLKPREAPRFQLLRPACRKRRYPRHQHDGVGSLPRSPLPPPRRRHPAATRQHRARPRRGWATILRGRGAGGGSGPRRHSAGNGS
jgi:hypothetical protein